MIDKSEKSAEILFHGTVTPMGKAIRLDTQIRAGIRCFRRSRVRSRVQ